MPTKQKLIEGYYDGPIESYDSASTKKLKQKITSDRDFYFLEAKNYSVKCDLKKGYYSIWPTNMQPNVGREWFMLTEIFDYFIINDISRGYTSQWNMYIKEKSIMDKSEKLRKETTKEGHQDAFIENEQYIYLKKKQLINKYNILRVLNDGPYKKRDELNVAFHSLLKPIFRFYQIPENYRLTFTRIAINGLKSKNAHSIPKRSGPHIFCYPDWRTLFEILKSFGISQKRIHLVIHALLTGEIINPLNRNQGQKAWSIYKNVMKKKN